MKIIHMDQKKLNTNKLLGFREPPVRVQDGDKVQFCMGVKIHGPSTLLYRPDAPLPSKARLWIETESEIEIIE